MKRVTTAVKILFRGVALVLGVVVLGPVFFRWDEMLKVFVDFYFHFSQEQAIWLIVIGLTMGLYIHSLYVRYRKVRAAKKRKSEAEK